MAVLRVVAVESGRPRTDALRQKSFRVSGKGRSISDEGYLRTDPYERLFSIPNQNCISQ